MKRVRNAAAAVLILTALTLTACGRAVSDKTESRGKEDVLSADGTDYGKIKSDFTGMTPEIAKAYLAVADELAEYLGYAEAEASEGEYLHGGFVRDWDSDGTPEMCLLLKTSPRESGSPDGAPVYGWFPPTLYLYSYRNGQAVRVGESDLYFATAGREAVIAALPAGNGLQYIRWDHTELTDETFVDSFELEDGTIRQTDIPAATASASETAATAREFLAAPGAETMQPLLYNSSGEARIEGEANARALRAALASMAS